MSLLARFQAGSELDSHGQFTLDESQARRKMARFQLASPDEFLLLMVQAAVAAGCQSVAIAIEGVQISLRAGEALLDGESLEQLEDFLFDAGPDNAAYQLLAVAMNAVETSSAEPPTALMEAHDLHIAVHLKAPLPDLDSSLRRRLAFLPCPLTLNGEAVPTVSLRDGPRVELAPGYVSKIGLVRYGVLLVTPRSQSYAIEFNAVVVADHLALDASFAQVIEGKEFQALINDLRRRAAGLLAERARAYLPGGEGTGELLAHFRKRHPDPAGSALDACAFFPLADRPGHYSLDDIRAHVKQYSRILYSARKYDLELSTAVLHVADEGLRRALADRLPGRAMEDADVEYTALVAAQRNKERWEKSPRPTELPPGNYLLRDALGGAVWEAAIGFLAAPGGQARVDVLYQGKLLTSEPLTEVPPGAAVVLNVHSGKVEPTWAGLDGREYRGILKELRLELKRVFEAHTFQAGDLYPQLGGYLMSQLQTRSIPPVALTAPLFPAADGSELFSLEQLQGMGQLSMGEHVVFSDRIPADCLPSPLLLYSGERRRALVNRLGSSRVLDAREFQQRLAAIDRKMLHPTPARLPLTEVRLLEESVQHPGTRGQVGLLEQRGGKLRCSLMRHGVEFEEVQAEGGRLFDVLAVLDTEGLTLKADWSGFERDAEYEALMESLRRQICAMEQRLLDQGENDFSRFLELLRAYPREKDTFWEKELIPTTRYGQSVSLARLAQEMKEHGHLLRGDEGVEIEGRLVLLRLEKQVNIFLLQHLGSVRWEEAAVLLRHQRAAEAFTRRPVASRIRVEGSFPAKAALPVGRGEIAFHPIEPGKVPGGELHCYVQGRYVGKKLGILAPPFVAALDSEEMVLNSTYDDVNVPDSLRAMLREAGAALMLKAAGGRHASAQETAWNYFTRSNDAEWRAKFEELVRFDQLSGGELTLSQIARERVRGYVTPGFSPPSEVQGAVLRLSEASAGRLNRYLPRKLKSLEGELMEEAARGRKLSALPMKLPAGAFSRQFSDGGLSAEIAIHKTPMAVGLDSEGRPLGMLKEPEFPVWAVVKGAVAEGVRAKEMRPDLPGRGYHTLANWAESLCLRWVKEKGDDPDLALHLLLLTVREVGSAKSRPSAEMAGLLWDMPLFKRVDGSRVSGSALARSLTETESRLVLSPRRFRTPDDVLLVEEGSVELKILQGALGRTSLTWYEAPALMDIEVDLTEFKQSIGKAVSWGLAPVGRGASYVGGKVAKAYDSLMESFNTDPRTRLVQRLREDAANLLGRSQFQRADGLFEALDFGRWPLGPPVYQVNPRSETYDPLTRQRILTSSSHFRLNLLHPAIRWLLSDGGDEQARRAARMMLLVHWIGQVNVASEQLTDADEKEFLLRLTERMARTFTAG